MAKKKHTILKRQGSNQHTLYGNFDIEKDKVEFQKVIVKDEVQLKHEQSDGSFGEHHTLNVDKGVWVTGKQVEYNPFKREITQIWD